MWITTKCLPLEYFQMAHMLVEKVGTMLESVMNNSKVKHPIFCASINVKRGWAKEVELITLTPRVLFRALINYDSLPIRCCFCLSIGHLIRECRESPTKRYSFHTGAKPQPDTGDDQPTT